jgi:uncharacterized protein YbjT (DUF2867 family)
LLVSNILLIGGTGFIGSHVLTRLAARAATPGERLPEPITRAAWVPGALPDRVPGRIIAITRDRRGARHLLMLPGVEVVEGDVHDDATLSRLLAALGPDATVINLAGILQDKRGKPYGSRFAQVHVALPRRLVAACAKHGVRRLLHMSALGAESAGASMYLRSKGDGEAAVTMSLLDWTVFRPSVVFGPGDRFLNLFARIQRFAPLVPLACADARFQPIAVDDVAQAIVNAFGNPETIQQCYDMGGPKVYTLAEIVRLAGEAAGHPRPILRLPSTLGRLQAMVLECLPGGLLSRDNLDSMRVDNILHGAMSPTLGVVPSQLETGLADALLNPQRGTRFERLRMRA